MPRYKVELISIDRENESKDVQFFTYVVATNREDAISKAMAAQKLERPDINPADTWCWVPYETAEK